MAEQRQEGAVQPAVPATPTVRIPVLRDLTTADIRLVARLARAQRSGG